ncbi:TPA: recombinase RecT, partial [Enterococcus faecium]|nr:recombinase RecT [Enterococcus faecium]HAQ0879487.1 recombinase RecT [Enterococcus faecium]
TKLSGVWASDYNAMARKTVLRNLLSKWGILSIEMQEATTSDERVQRVQEDGSIIAETEVEEDIPERKEAEVISEENEDVQTGLFDASNPPLNK